MATLQEKIANKFLARLEQSRDVDAVKIEHLRILLAGTKKIKADDFVRIFSLPAGNDIK